MPCLPIQVSDRVDEHGECEDCGVKHVMATALVAADEDPSSSSLLQMMAAVEIVLQGVGEDVEREGLLKTPLRVASALKGAIAGYQLSAKEIVGAALFSEVGTGGGTGYGGGSGGIVVVSNIDSFSLCESCLLPFKVRCHVVYIPSGQRVVGLSKLPRVAEIFAKRLQNPQKLADEIVEALNESLRPLGVGAVVESWHLQWPGDCESDVVAVGGNAQERLEFGWVPVSVYAGRGQFEHLHCSLWDEFLTILQLEGVDIEKPTLGALDGQSGRRKSCPFIAYDGEGISSVGSYDGNSPEVICNGSSGPKPWTNGAGLTMASVSASAATLAVGLESLLRAAGEVPSKEEVRATALRFVNWILSATQGSRGFISNGQDHGLSGNAHSNGLLSYGNGSLSNGNGPANDHRVNGSVSGFTIQSNGTGHGNVPLTNVSAIHSNGNNLLSDGSSSNGVSYLNHHSVVVNGLQSSSNGVSRYGNGALSGSKSTMSNGCSLLKLEVISGADHAESLVCLELDMPFSSLCEHHLLPFFGIVHLGYVLGRGSQHIDHVAVKQIVRTYSRRLQMQERVTRQIAEAIMSFAGLQGAMVVAEASHVCIMSRGVEKLGSSTVTVVTLGKFSKDSAMRTAFLKRISRKGAKKMG